MITEKWAIDLEEKRANTIWGLTPTDCAGLYTFIKEKNIKTVVETGVCFGFSSCYMLEAVGEDGRLISIDHALKAESDLLVPKSHYSHWITLKQKTSDCLEWVFKHYSPVELFFHDSGHTYENMMFEYTTAHNNGVKYIGSDDVTKKFTGTVWKDFLEKYGYEDMTLGLHARIAWRKP